MTARTDTFIRPVTRSAFVPVRLLFVRHGSAIVTWPKGERATAAGDVLVLASDTPLGGMPEGAITITTVFADEDYLLSQIYWQYAGTMADPAQLADLMSERFPGPVRVLRIGEARMGLLAPWLDGLVEWTLDGAERRSFFRMEAHLASVLNVLSPFLSLDVIDHTSQQVRCSSTPTKKALFRPTRPEAAAMRQLLDNHPAQQWTLASLAERVHLSAAQGGRVFVATYGLTPLAYQAHVRVREMSRLLRATDLPIGVIENQVGWRDRGHAAATFRRYTGLTPRDYRNQLSSG